MPPVDLDSLVSVCGGGGGADNKIACETLAEDAAPAAVPENPDLPPDSFWLSKDDELDWFDRNAFFDRKDSTKGGGGGGGGTNSISANLTATASVSQRFSINLTKSKTSIFGLPRPQKLQAAQVCRRGCKPPNVRLFPKRAAPAAAPVAEPSSPKVSCMGRVRSKRDRSRRSRNRPALAPEALRKKEKTGRTRRPGLWTSLTSIFRSVSKTKPVQRHESYLPPAAAPRGSLPGERELPPRRSTVSAVSDFSDSDRPTVGPPGLGGAMRFSSGRRSESWVVVDGVDSSRVEEEEEAVAASDREPVWGRRGVGPLGLDEVQCRREWEIVGPPTV